MALPRGSLAPSTAQALGSLNQHVPTLPDLGDPLRQEIAHPLADSIIGGPLPVNLALAEKVRALAEAESCRD